MTPVLHRINVNAIVIKLADKAAPTFVFSSKIPTLLEVANADQIHQSLRSWKLKESRGKLDIDRENDFEGDRIQVDDGRSIPFERLN